MRVDESCYEYYLRQTISQKGSLFKFRWPMLTEREVLLSGENLAYLAWILNSDPTNVERADCHYTTQRRSPVRARGCTVSCRSRRVQTDLPGPPSSPTFTYPGPRIPVCSNIILMPFVSILCRAVSN